MNKYYIHGYGSTGQTSYNGLVKAGIENLSLVNWTSDRPYEVTLNQIHSQIDLDNECTLIASSFGGFWAS